MERDDAKSQITTMITVVMTKHSGNRLYKSKDTSVPQPFLLGKGEGLEGKRTWGIG